MELKTTEVELNDIVLHYETLRRGYSDWQKKLLPLSSVFQTDTDVTINGTVPLSATAALETLESIKARIEGLQTVVRKFEKRLKENDPITGKPRYGSQTANRVQNILNQYNELFIVIVDKTFNSECHDLNETNNESSESKRVIDTIKIFASRELEDEKQKEYDEFIRIQNEKAAQIAIEQQQLEEIRRRDEEIRYQAEVDRQEQILQVRRIREAELQQQRENARRDREWIASIPNKKSLTGVKEQLEILETSTSGNTRHRTNAISALQKIFHQIVTHPEENNFRRIRRDHPKFLADVGNHEGGKEFLIVAGFELGVIDEVPSFICKEPDLESDMDGWSAWYDLLKNTLKILDEHMGK